jgi:capsular polysaccharide transport system permease protein
LEEQARLIRKKINELMRQLFNSKNSIAGGSVKLQILKSQFLLLQKEVEMNLMAFLQAQNQAYLQHLFIETLDKPRIPDTPTEPEKFKNVFVAFTLSFAVWGILVLFIAGIREHVNA